VKKGLNENMKKLKIYLDTSIVSHLDHKDAPEKMQDTLWLWEDIKKGKYEVYFSGVVFDEINKCKIEKLNTLMSFINEIEYKLIVINEEIYSVAERIVDFGVLCKKSFDDCLHIASAIVSNCDVIVSWNFTHIVNHNIIKGVKLVTTSEGYRDILIYTPTFLTGGEENEHT
jgi:predicted nucleic acid-binding protein